MSEASVSTATTRRPRASGVHILAGASRSKCPRTCSHQSSTRLGRPASAQITKNHDPAGRLGDKSRAGRQIGAADRGERGEQRVLRRRVQRVLAQRREIGDEDHRADRAGEVLRDDGEGRARQRRSPTTACHGEREVGGRLQQPADPEAGRRADRRGRQSRRQSRRSAWRRGRRP